MAEKSEAVPPPTLVLFDVNETLSDMSPLRTRFEEVGLASHEVEAWFAGLLRDGFSLTAAGENPDFAQLASDGLARRVRGHVARGGRLRTGIPADEAAARVMAGFGQLPVHPDVVEGVVALSSAGIRLATLSNGATSVAAGLLARAGIDDHFERLLSVADGPAWKPARASYAWALEVCGVPAEEAMLVAVHPWDIDGAARAGLRTGWLTRAATDYPSYFTPPEVSAGDLEGLAAAFGVNLPGTRARG